MKILEDLWHGQICPIAQADYRNNEYRELTMLFERIENRLLATMSTQQQEDLQRMNDLWGKMDQLAECAAFVKGFRLAVQIKVTSFYFGNSSASLTGRAVFPGTLPRPKNAPPGRCSISTEIGLAANGTLPRAKKVSTGHFFASLRSAALFESLIHPMKNPSTKVDGFFMARLYLMYIFEKKRNEIVRSCYCF